MDNGLDERSGLESILEYLHLIWRWAWLLLLAALIAGGGAYFLTNRQPRVYLSSTRMMVNSITGAQNYDPYSQTFMGQRLAETYAKTMINDTLLQTVEQRMGAEVTGSVVANAVKDSPVIDISVSDNNPQKAADTANAVVEVFSEKIIADQSIRYSEIKGNLESEIARIDKELTAITEKLAVLQVSTTGNPIITGDYEAPADYVKRVQLELAQSQYQQTRSMLFYNLQQVKLSEVQSTTTVTQLDKAIPNSNPIQPRPLRNGIQGALVGLVIAAAVVFLINALQDEIRDPDEITRKWGVPVLGLITRFNTDNESLVTISQPRAPVSESFRLLRTNLQFAEVNTPLHTILVTSASPGDGKTTIAANLAHVISQNNQSVVAIDSDLRKPRMHKVFQLSNRVGLTDYFLHSEEKTSGIVKKTKAKALFVITSGSLPPNPSELLNSQKMTEMIEELRKHFNTLILDSPPLLAVADALVLAPRADGVILVVNPGVSKRGTVKYAIDQLRRVNANLLGVVLNNVKVKRTQYYYTSKYYGKEYGRAKDAQIEEEIQDSHLENAQSKKHTDPEWPSLK